MFEQGIFGRGKEGNQPTLPRFDFPVDKDPSVIAEELEREIINLGLAETLPTVPVVQDAEPIDAREEVQQYLAAHKYAKFLGDEIVTEEPTVTKALQLAIDGTDKPVVSRELFVNTKTGAMAETLFEVTPDPANAGVITALLRTRWLRAPRGEIVSFSSAD